MPLPTPRVSVPRRGGDTASVVRLPQGSVIGSRVVPANNDEATGLEHAASGVTGLYGLNQHSRLRTRIIGYTERTGCDRLGRCRPRQPLYVHRGAVDD